MTGTNGAHVKVTVRMDDRIFETVDDLIAHLDEPCHTTGRSFPSPIVRQMLSAFGVATCPDCHRYTALRAPRSRWRERL